MISASLSHRLTMLEVKYARMLREEITPQEYAEERIKAEQAIADAIARSSRPRPSTERRTLVQGEEGAGMEDMGGRRAQLRIPSQGADSLSTQPTNGKRPPRALSTTAGDDAGAMGALVPTTEDTRRSA